MSVAMSSACREAAPEALASGTLPENQRHTAQAHLETCIACRERYRQLTADRFPNIPEYTIVDLIGQGGFGAVYRAVSHIKQRTEALKVHSHPTRLNVAAFENEVRLVASLKHPNIATLYDARLSGSPAYYSMEFVEGEQMHVYLRRTRAPLAQRIDLMKKIGAAIGYAHAHGVIHRDIKPQNILIDSSGEPRIVDFGIARRLGLEVEADPRAPAGTFGFMAPEQLSGRPVDHRADIYALGALLFTIVTGEHARQAHRRERLVEVLRRLRAPRPEDLASIIARCVSPEPRDRYQSCAELVADLESFQENLPIAARERPPWGYRAARIGAYLLTHHPNAARAMIVVSSAVLLTWLLSSFRAHWFAAPMGTADVALIRFTENTLSAIRSGELGRDLRGLDADNPYSLRLLHGQLMQRLAIAHPRLIAWDYFFPRCQDEFDAAFVAAIRSVGAPVLVGAAKFDVNGAPEICPTIAAAVGGVGALASTKPDSVPDFFAVPYALIRGFERPVPSLAVVAYAALRQPDATPDLLVGAQYVQIRYVRREARAGEARFLPETDVLPAFQLGGDPVGAGLTPNDRLVLGAVRNRTLDEARIRRLDYETALTMPIDALVREIGELPVLVGQAIVGKDEHLDNAGRRVFGCEIHALALQSLMLREHPRVLARPEVAVRALLWCLLATSLGALLAKRAAIRVKLRVAVVLGGAAILAGVIGALLAASDLSDRIELELAILLCATAIAGGVTLVFESALRRQVEISGWQLFEDTTTTATAPSA